MMKYGRYEIVNELGKGAMGVVYQAHDPRIDRLIALKVLRQDRVSSEDLVRRFLKEARAIGRLSHPNIVTVYDVGQDQGTIYIAMELLEGKPLNELYKERRLSYGEIVSLCSQIALALGYAHNQGVVHRDVKPTNIIVTPDNQVKLTDFGIAHFEDPEATQQTQAGEILGTPSYMSMEQVMGNPVDGRSDLYSLGVILYELSTGKRPFKGATLSAVFMAIAQETPDSPRKIDDKVPPSLSDLIMKSLGKKPEDRFQTGAQMEEALKTCLQVPGPEISEFHEQGKKKTSKTPLILVIIAICLIGIGLGGYYLTGRTGTKAPIPIRTNALKKPSPGQKTEIHSILKVTSEPDMAQIFINGAFKGQTPLTLDLALGKYEVRVLKPSYYDWEAQIKLDKKGETPLYVRLIPKND